MKRSIELLQQFGESPDLAASFGYVTSWHVIGPFDNVGGVGFNAIYPPETELDFSQQYQGKNGKVGWKELETQGKDIEKVGVVDLNQAVVEEKGVVAYVAATFISAREQVLECQTMGNGRNWGMKEWKEFLSSSYSLIPSIPLFIAVPNLNEGMSLFSYCQIHRLF